MKYFIGNTEISTERKAIDILRTSHRDQLLPLNEAVLGLTIPLPGELYLSEDPANLNGLIWFDDENGVFFVMTSYYLPEIMERIAEGVVLGK